MIGVLVAAALASSPIIFKNYVYEEEAVVRPMAKSLLGFNLQQLNDFRKAANPALDFGTLCYVEAMTQDGVALLTRDGQAQLAASFKNSGATFDMDTPGGIRLTVGVYEKCEKAEEGHKKWGSVLIATQAGKLVWSEDYPGIAPLFLYRPRGTNLAALSSCMECGDVTELYYDPANRKFYTQYVGD